MSWKHACLYFISFSFIQYQPLLGIFFYWAPVWSILSHLIFPWWLPEEGIPPEESAICLTLQLQKLRSRSSGTSPSSQLVSRRTLFLLRKAASMLRKMMLALGICLRTLKRKGSLGDKTETTHTLPLPAASQSAWLSCHNRQFWVWMDQRRLFSCY